MIISKADLQSQDWNASTPGFRFKAVRRHGKQLRLVEFEPGDQEWCTTGHVGYVLEGELELEFRDNTETLRKGDGLLIRAGEAERHKPRAIGSTVRLLLVEDV